MPKLHHAGFGLAVLFVLAGAEPVVAQTLTIVPGAYVVPAPGGVGTFPSSGTYKMGAGTNYSRITYELQQKLAGGNWTSIGGPAIAARTGVTEGEWSATISWDKVAGASYQVRATLYKSGGIPVQNAPIGGGWVAVP